MENFAEAIRSARQSRGLSQTALGHQIGWPQSYISKLESGQIDPQLSNVTEIARSLDLEVVFIPRSLIPVLNSLQRTSQVNAARSKRIHLTQQLRQTSLALRHIAEEKQFTAAQKSLVELSSYFRDTVIPESLMHAARSTAHTVEQSLNQLSQMTASDGDTLAHTTLRKALNTLQRLRRQIEQAPKVSLDRTAARPAYAFDEDDDDSF